MMTARVRYTRTKATKTLAAMCWRAAVFAPHLAIFLWQVSSVAAETAESAQAVQRVEYELARLRPYDDERLPLVFISAVAIAVVAIVWYVYRRDTVCLPRGVRAIVVGLRFLALAGLFVFFLGIERRTTTEVVHNSQVAVLVDVSQSMGLSEGEESLADEHKTRIEAIVRAFADSPLLRELRQTHDVNIAKFDQEVEAVVTLPKTGERSGNDQRTAAADLKSSESAPAAEFDWTAALQPRGTKTRLGQALADQLRQYRDAPLAGLVVISDGAHNAGIEPTTAVESARSAKVPIFTIGVGSTQTPRNVALRDLVVPTRAFPGDTLHVTGYLQSHGYGGRSVEVQLTRRVAGDHEGVGTLVASQRVALAADGEMVPVTFEIDPGEAGTYVFRLRIEAPADDGNQRDNQRDAEVEIVDRQTRVLLFASGPMRDYQYLRNQLYRDKSMTVDVLLQSAQGGISQEANEILEQLPTSAEELYQYDAIVAFDPDWTQLDMEQVELLENWVSEEAGGMIVVVGPIQTPKWLRSREHAKLRDLYPVTFQQRITLMDDGHFGGQSPWPLAFERAGREAKFLWLGNTAEESEAAWDSFPGVYGYYAVRGEKPGATVYARFSDPQTGSPNQRPVYFAGHFYGAGRVFYMGSGEMWRLRSVDPALFEVLYTKLIRHVSQGRLLRGSTRGSLLVERDRYELGETVVLRARLSDEQYKPLSLEYVTAQVLRPDGSTEAVRLAAEADRPGMYAGQMPVMLEGTYHVALSAPGDEEPLTRYLQVRVPDLERTHAERNETLLAALADNTGGIYYRQLDTAIRGDETTRPLSQVIPSRAEIKLIRGAPDQDFARAQMHWLLGLIAGSLFLEWIVRRLNRLA